MPEYRLAIQAVRISYPPGEGVAFAGYTPPPNRSWWVYELCRNNVRTGQYLMAPHPHTGEDGFWFISMSNKTSARWKRAGRGRVTALQAVVDDYEQYSEGITNA